MIKKFQILSILLLFSVIGKSQIIDKYGVNIGLIAANQSWDYKLNSQFSKYQDYRNGVSIFCEAEKELINVLSFRAELGYVQKGFHHDFLLPDSTSPQNSNVLLNVLAMDLGLKYSPFKSKVRVYSFAGLRSDYMFAFRDIIFIEQGSSQPLEVFQPILEMFNTFNLSALVGLGLDFKNTYYLELILNPALSNRLNIDWILIKDQSYSLKFGVYLNELIK